MLKITLQQTPDGSRIPELDGVRAIAVLLVIAYHYGRPFYSGATGWRRVVFLPASTGWIGVDLFFVLSGYLIASILMANREAPAFFSTFYIRRSCRILPLYLPLVLVFHPLVTWRPQPPLYQYLTFTQNFWMASASDLGNDLLAVTWSLAIEEQFYLLLPALIRFNPPKRLLAIVISCIGLAVLLRYVFMTTCGRDSILPIQVLLPTRLDPLMLGVLVAWLRMRGVAVPRFAVRAVWVVSGTFMAFAFLRGPASDGIPHPFMGALFKLIIALFFVTTLLIAMDGGFRFLRWRVLTYTGLISYGLYLLHIPVDLILRRLREPAGNVEESVLLTIALIVTWAAAAVSWELFEKRFVRYGHRFRYEGRHSSPSGALPRVNPESESR